MVDFRREKCRIFCTSIRPTRLKGIENVVGLLFATAVLAYGVWLMHLAKKGDIPESYAFTRALPAAALVGFYGVALSLWRGEVGMRGVLIKRQDNPKLFWVSVAIIALSSIALLVLAWFKSQ